MEFGKSYSSVWVAWGKWYIIASPFFGWHWWIGGHLELGPFTVGKED